MSMTPKENFKAFLADQPYEWRPMRDDILRFSPQEFPDYPCKGLVSQQEPYKGPAGGRGWFGVEWLYEPQAGGAIDVGRVIDSIADWEKVPFTPLDSYDWEGIAERNSEFLARDKFLQLTLYSGFMERLIALINFEDTLLTLIDEDLQEPLWAFFSKLSDYYIDFIRRCRKHFGIEFVEIHDDWGAQNAPLISMETQRKTLQPHIKKVIDACHEEGIVYLQHSCGRVQEIFDCIVESGADTWIGQWGVNDRVEMYHKYPGFHFGAPIRPANTGTVDDMIRSAEEQLRVYDGLRVWFFTDLRRIPKDCLPQVRSFIRDYIMDSGQV